MAKVLTETVAGIIPFPAGMVMAFAGSTPPPGWLPCDGSLLSRTTYAILFAVIGTGWGSGDGSTTFHLPDLRGRFLRGVDGAAGRDPNSGTRTASNAGGNTGNSVGSVQANATAVNGLLNASSALTATAAAQAWTYGVASGTAAAQAWTYGVASGTAAGQTLSVAAVAGSGTATTINLAHTHSTPALTLGVTQSVTSGDIPHLHAAGTLSVGTGLTGSVGAFDVAHTHSGSTLTAATGVNLAHGHGVSDPAHTHLYSQQFGLGVGASMPGGGPTNGGLNSNFITNSAGTGISINNSVSLDHSHSVSGSTGGPSVSLSHQHSPGTMALSSGAVANSTANNTGSIAHTHDINHTHPAGNTGAASVSLDHTHPVNVTTSINHTHGSSSVTGVTGTNADSSVTGVTGTNATSTVSGTAAAQVLSGDAETRPLNANVNYIIKT